MNSKLFLLLFWIAMGFSLGSIIWILRIFLIIQSNEIYMAFEPNSLILNAEIFGFIIGMGLTLFILVFVSKMILVREIYE